MLDTGCTVPSPCAEENSMISAGPGGSELLLAPGSCEAAKGRVIDQLPQGPPVGRRGTSPDIQAWRKGEDSPSRAGSLSVPHPWAPQGTPGLHIRHLKQSRPATSCKETLILSIYQLPVIRHHRHHKTPHENHVSGVCPGGAGTLNFIRSVTKLQCYDGVENQ